MSENEMLAIVEALANQPTAPFHEDAVRAEIEAQLRKVSHVNVRRDSFGNLIAHYQRGRLTKPKWAFAAHMDHPGWVRGKKVVGLTAGASAPEEVVEECLAYLRRHHGATVESRTVREEHVSFPLPRELRVLAG